MDTGHLLEIFTLGPAEFRAQKRPIAGLGSGKMTALLVYLALQPGYRHPRETLAELLWPELSLQAARFNLRHTYFHLREALGDEQENGFLIAGREWLSFNPCSNHWCDITEFANGLVLPDPEPERLANLAHMYRGEFMAGFSLPDCQEFERWLQLKREETRRQAVAVMELLTQRHESLGIVDKALTYAHRLCALDPLNDANQCRVMRLFATYGQPAAALAQYDSFRSLLEDQLGALPNHETERLREQIARGEIRPSDHPTSAGRGTPPPSEPTERRQVTVLYCELSVANVDDAEEAAEFLREPQQGCIDRLRAAGGHVTLSHGGTLLAYFGYPHAREDAAVSAVAAAQAIVGTTAPASVRCGIHTGAIVTSPSLHSPDVAGKASMVAMHLALAAAPNSIALSESTFHIVDGQVPCRRSQDLLSIPSGRPMGMYTVANARASDKLKKAVANRSHFVGRATELRQLDLFWQQTCAGKPVAVMLRGEPGIGKSRLTSEFAKNILTLERGTVKEYACLSQHQGTSFQPFSELLPQTIPQPLPRSKGKRPGQLLDEILDAILTKTARKPQLVAIEDIHWADASSLELIEALIAQARNTRTMVLLTARSDFAPPAWTSTTNLIELRPLPTAFSHQLTKLLAPSLTEEQVQRLVAQADGVPLFIEELARWIQLPDQSFRPEQIPTTLQDLLMARIDKVGSARRLAQIAATVGKSVSRELLLALAASDKIALNEDLSALLDSGLLVRKQGEIHFKHALIQQAAYLSQTLGTRRHTHQLVATVLRSNFPDTCHKVPETLAHHLSECGQLDDAAHYWQLAGSLAAQRSGHSEAVCHYRKALDILTQSPRRERTSKAEFAVTAALGMQLVLTKGLGSSEAQSCFADAYAMCQDVEDSERLFPVVHGQWIGAGCYSTYLHAEELTERLRHLAQISGRPDFYLVAHMAKIVTLFWIGRPADVPPYLELVRPLALKSDLNACIRSIGVDPLVYSLVFSGLSVHFLGHFDDAVRFAKEASVLAEESGYGDSKCVALTMTALLDRYLGKAKQVASHCTVISALAETYGIPLWAAGAKCLTGWAMAVQGNEAGADLSREGLLEVRQNMASAEAMFGSVYLDALVALGRHKQVLADVDPIIDAARGRHDCHITSELYRLKGESLQALSPNKSRAAEACFRQAVAIAEQAGAKALELRAAISLFGLKQDETTRSRLERIVSWFGKHQDIPDIAKAWRLVEARRASQRAPVARSSPRLKLVAA